MKNIVTKLNILVFSIIALSFCIIQRLRESKKEVIIESHIKNIIKSHVENIIKSNDKKLYRKHSWKYNRKS